MSLADALAAPAADSARCPIPDLIASLPDRDADALRAAFEPGGRSDEYIHAVLRADGIAISRTSVERHRTRVGLLRGLPRRALGCSCTDL